VIGKAGIDATVTVVETVPTWFVNEIIEVPALSPVIYPFGLIVATNGLVDSQVPSVVVGFR